MPVDLAHHHGRAAKARGADALDLLVVIRMALRAEDAPLSREEREAIETAVGLAEDLGRAALDEARAAVAASGG